MARNIVLCCDGTSNQFSSDRTSVIKLFHALVKDPSVQMCYYHPGIGTRAPTGIGTKVGTWLGKTAGLAFGYKLQDDIVDAYRFLMNNYQDGDKVFIFGFSRGAYTARVIAGMLHLYGLAMAGNDPLVPYAVEMMWAISGVKTDDARNDYFQLARDFRATMGSRDCPVHFLGLWDTVNSVGWIGSPLMLPYTRSNPGVAIVRHAMAIDEHRAFFRVNWFKPTPGSDIQEVWFPGSHGDVGGGYPENDAGMSKYPLEWMIKEASANGLAIDEMRKQEVLGFQGNRFSKASPKATLHNSMTFFWVPFEFVPKKFWNHDKEKWEWRINFFDPRTLPDNPVVHSVAWQIPDYALPKGAVSL